ncbi:hypothetical protein BXU11_08115 [Flavobacterium sp. LM5]|uniref:hypothetical protein n=1 Tax=Flavobacterium sp. LM5 TaxID=1938610 RepID=UPI0009926086|nr:hypothetical protein [Flavobacterium sp. LM5]OOV29820.1 hypothetical protein BXU11_08115 [Flavobacterium sp. LM5]
MKLRITKTLFYYENETNRTSCFYKILLIVIFTKHSQKENKEKVKETYRVYYQKSLKDNQTGSENAFSKLDTLLGNSIINTIVENATVRDNYLIFL